MNNDSNRHNSATRTQLTANELQGAFYWDNTEEGREYWADIVKRLERIAARITATQGNETQGKW